MQLNSVPQIKWQCRVALETTTLYAVWQDTLNSKHIMNSGELKIQVGDIIYTVKWEASSMDGRMENHTPG